MIVLKKTYIKDTNALKETVEKLKSSIDESYAQNDVLSEENEKLKKELELLSVDYENEFDKFSKEVEEKTKELTDKYQKVIDDDRKFFEDTVDNVEQSLKYMKELSKREILSNDPDIQMVNRIINFFYMTLINYLQQGAEVDSNIEIEIVKAKEILKERGVFEDSEKTEETGKSE